MPGRLARLRESPSRWRCARLWPTWCASQWRQVHFQTLGGKWTRLNHRAQHVDGKCVKRQPTSSWSGARASGGGKLLICPSSPISAMVFQLVFPFSRSRCPCVIPAGSRARIAERNWNKMYRQRWWPWPPTWIMKKFIGTVKTASRASPSVAKALLWTPEGYANDYAKNNDVLQENHTEERTRWKDGGGGHFAPLPS